MKEYVFDAEILLSEEVGAGAFVLFPYDPMECFSKRNMIKIVCTFDGEPYRGVIANMGIGPCIGVLKSIREKIAKGRGDTVHVVLSEDTEPRKAECPDDLLKAIEESTGAKAFWRSLSYSAQKQYADFVLSAKKEETRTKRIIDAVQKLTDGIKRPK